MAAVKEKVVRTTGFDRGMLVALLLVFVEHLVLRRIVKAYYATHLPHYDSIGSYSFAFDVLHISASKGWVEGVMYASTFGLSLTQSLYAAVFAPFLSPTPHSLLTYNSLSLGILSCAIYALVRVLGGSMMKGIGASVLPLIPDAFYWWNGGLQDWQRDTSYFCLLASAFLLFYRHVYVKTICSGMLFGLATALTIISRDSAPGYVLMILVPPAVVWVIALAVKGRLRGNVTAVVVPLATATVGAVAYGMFMLEHTLRRYGNAYIMFGWDTGVRETLIAHWYSPFALLLGVAQGYGATLQKNVFVAVAACCMALLLSATGVIRIRPGVISSKEMRTILFGGLWAFLVTMFFLIGVVRFGAAPFSGAKPMFYPTLLFFLCAGIVIILAIDAGKLPLTARIGLTVAWCAVWIGIIPIRVAQKTFDEDPNHLAALPVLTMLSSERPGIVIASFWHDGINPDVLRYYAAQANRPRPRHLSFILWDGLPVDLAIGAPKGSDVARMRDDFYHATLCYADIVVLSPRFAIYDQPENPMFIFRHGRPLVERLRSTLQENLVYKYTWYGTPLEVFDNSAKSQCDAARAPLRSAG